MGLEAISMAPYDDPAWFEDMVETMTNLSLKVLERVFASGIDFSFCDHRVPPDVPLTHYLHYLKCARAIWCNQPEWEPPVYRPRGHD